MSTRKLRSRIGRLLTSTVRAESLSHTPTRRALASPLTLAALAMTLLAAAPTPTQAATVQTSKSQKSGKAYVRILSYNVKGLPSIINSYKKSRFPVIGKLLAERRRAHDAPDIVLLQEAFISPTLEIHKESGYPYLHKGPSAKGINPNGKKFGKLLNGGIYVMSEFPFKKTERMNFPSNSCGTFDCFANKGAQYVSVRIPGMPFDLQILNTHTQAEPKYEAIRENQFQWLNYFLRTNVNYNDPYRAVIFGGDFNSKPSIRASHKYFVDLSDLQDVGAECRAPRSECKIKDGTNPLWIYENSMDHFFYASGKKVRIRPVEVERNFTEQHKGKTLSDHLGYEVLFEITWSS